MKYFEKLGAEDKGSAGTLIGGAAGAGLGIGRAIQKKDEIKANMKEAYKSRRIPGNAAANRVTRKGLRIGGKAGLGLAVGAAGAIGAGIGSMFN
jgi:hypothetical protein